MTSLTAELLTALPTTTPRINPTKGQGMTTTAATGKPAHADVAAQVDALVDNLEQRVWAEIPAVQAATENRQAALTAGPALNRLLATLPTVGGVVQSTWERLVDGQAVDPEAFAAGLAAASATADAIRFAAIASQSGIEAARNALTAAQVAHQGAALAVLDRKVGELVAIARPLLEAADELEGTSRYSEIGATQVAIQRAAVAHTRIRTVQLAITSSEIDTNPVALLRTFGIVRDVTACLPTSVPMAAPAGAGYRPDVPEITDGEAMLRFVCRPDLEPWVPTYGEARAAKTAFDQHVRTLREGAVNPTRPDRDGSNDPHVVVRGDLGQRPVIGVR